MSLALCVALLLIPTLSFTFVQAQSQQAGYSIQNSWPHVYPGMPTGDYSPEWQNYFQVTENLPNVTWPLARNWAGNIPVQREGHPNNTLFFWAFESSDGSFTSDCDEPWGIWLNGGPGSPSLFGLLFENGPIHVLGDYSVVENQYAWSTFADHVWVDQPVGTGFSTVDAGGLVADEDQVAADFMGFLDNFIKVFPNLATRPLHLNGESYAGKYIPYIAKAYFEMENPPVNLAGIAIGNGAFVSIETFTELPVLRVLETYPQIIGYDTQVYEYFQEQSALCGYNLTLQYPQPHHFPTPGAPVSPNTVTETSLKYTANAKKKRASLKPSKKLVKHNQLGGTFLRKRDSHNLANRANGTIDPWYQCDIHNEIVDYALNFTFPWSSGHQFDIYNIPDALSPEAVTDGSVFLNDARTRAAIHAPTSKDWMDLTFPVFTGPISFSSPFGDPSVEPMAFLTELATNATAHGVKIVIYSGNDDSLLPHFGSQIGIQNTTFGGIQGFTRRPETPWYNDAGDFAGIVHQERGWTYVLVAHAGHFTAYTNPISALTLAREFIFGDNPTGLVTDSSSGTGIVECEESILGKEILRGQAGIYYGNTTATHTYFFPAATVEAWDAYMAAASATAAKKSCTPNIH